VDKSLKLLATLVSERSGKMFDMRKNVPEQLNDELIAWSEGDIDELQHELRSEISHKQIEYLANIIEFPLPGLPQKFQLRFRTRP